MPESGNNMRELIAFRIGDQEFCVDIMCVREIRGWAPSTLLPHSPNHVLGVINLRGTVLPIMDLSRRLGMEETDATKRHVIIVTQVASQYIGILVDGVSDILTIANDTIQPTPEVTANGEHGFAVGMIPIDGRMICLIQLEALFANLESEAA